MHLLIRKGVVKLSVPVIDFHIHAVNYQEYHPAMKEFVKNNHAGEDQEEFIKKYSDPDNFVAYLRDCGVDYGIVMAELCPITSGICTNEYISEFCRDQERLIPFASLNPYLIDHPARELERLVKEQGMRGLKLYPTYNYFYPNEPMLYPIYAKAEEYGIPVMIHTGSSVFPGARMKYGDPLFFDDIAVDFPELTLLLTHCGRGFWYDKAYFLSRLHANLYMEVTGLPPYKLLDYFPELERNADKVIFGTDWPAVPSIKANVEAIRALPINEAAKEKILGGNAARILKMTV